jgi:hypothetical protein
MREMREMRKRGNKKKYNTYHIQGHHGIHLDCSVEITEYNGDGQQKKVDWVPNVMTNQLDPLAGEHPQAESHHCMSMRSIAPSDGSLVAQPHQEEVAQQGRRRQSRQVYCIGAPGLTTARQVSCG